MSDLIQNGLLGALLSKAPGAPTVGENLKDAGESTETAIGVTDLFGDLFNVAAAAKSAAPTPTFQIGLFIKQPPAATLATLAPTDNDATASAPASATTTVATNTFFFNPPEIAFDISLTEDGAPSAELKELFAIRPETPTKLRDIKSLFADVEGLPSSLAAQTPEHPFALLKKGAPAFATVKLGEPQSQIVSSSLSTVKQAPTLAVAADFSTETTKFPPLSVDIKSLEIAIVRPRAIAQAFNPLAPAFGFQQAVLEIAPDEVRLFETRLPKLDTPPPLTESVQPAVIKTPLIDAFGRLAADIPEQFASYTKIEADLRLDPALAPPSSASSIQSVNSLAPAASHVSPAQTAMAGVLPQIQAAVFARHGRDVVEVRLDPPDLGRVRIDFNVENGETVKAVLGAERTETLDYLKRNIVDLENHLKQAGFSSISFEFSSAERHFGDEDAGSQAAEQFFFDGDEVVDFRPKIYLSARENARLDLLL